MAALLCALVSCVALTLKRPIRIDAAAVSTESNIGTLIYI